MTSRITVSLALVVAALAAGCAADSQMTTSSEPKAPPEYRTGSNIPVREHRSTSEEAKSRAAAPADAQQPADPAGKTTN
jgi:hypothetical protein